MNIALMCLALTVFHEARGEPLVGQQAVAQVVLNRAKIREKPVCGVILEKGQFSWHPEQYIVAVKQGKKTVYKVNLQRIPVGKPGWLASVKAAEKATSGENTFNNAEFFHAKQVKPRWKGRYVEVFRAGNHVFYARKDQFSPKKVAFLPSSGPFS